MSVRLALASLWLPPWVVCRELVKVERATTSALDRLLAARACATSKVAGDGQDVRHGSVRRRRAALAAAHTERVARLVETLGRESAIREARRMLYDEGVRLGEAVRERLSVGWKRRDLVRAARVLYRVLGIRFRAEWTTDCEARVEITRCALAHDYSLDACRALSATDAGVVAGLWPGARLEFDERITEGKPACIARLTLPLEGCEGEP
jgi:hypothetical protein